MIELSQLQKRLFWSAILIAVAAYAIFFAPQWFFLIVLEAVMVVALLEYFSLAERKGFVINRYLGVFFSILLPLPLHLTGKVFILTVAVLCIFIYNFHRRLRNHALVSTAVSLFGIIYVGFFFSFLSEIHQMPFGAWWTFYIIFILKMGDAAAYFVGKQFGMHKYIVHISPNKSVEGALAGFVMTIAASALSKIYLPHIPLLHLLILGAVLGVLGQFGDLAESLLKRDAEVKDSGVIPGLGGFLDVVDCLLLAVPALYYYLSFFLDFHG